MLLQVFLLYLFCVLCSAQDPDICIDNPNEPYGIGIHLGFYYPNNTLLIGVNAFKTFNFSTTPFRAAEEYRIKFLGQSVATPDLRINCADFILDDETCKYFGHGEGQIFDRTIFAASSGGTDVSFSLFLLDENNPIAPPQHQEVTAQTIKTQLSASIISGVGARSAMNAEYLAVLLTANGVNYLMIYNFVYTANEIIDTTPVSIITGVTGDISDVAMSDTHLFYFDGTNIIVRELNDLNVQLISQPLAATGILSSFLYYQSNTVMAIHSLKRVEIFNFTGTGLEQVKLYSSPEILGIGYLSPDGTYAVATRVQAADDINNPVVLKLESGVWNVVGELVQPALEIQYGIIVDDSETVYLGKPVASGIYKYDLSLIQGTVGCTTEECSLEGILCNDTAPFLSASSSVTPSITPSLSFTSSISKTSEPSRSSTISKSISLTSSNSKTISVSSSTSKSESATSTNSHSKTSSLSLSKSNTISKSNTVTPTISITPSSSASTSVSPSISDSSSFIVDNEQILPPVPDDISVSLSSSPSKSISLSVSKSREVVMNLCNSPNCYNNDNEDIIDNTNNDPIVFIYSDGELIATVNLDVDESGILQIIPGDAFVSNQVASSILDITLLNEFGISIQPSNNIEICFNVNDNIDKDDSCLGFFNEETKEWECEDRCLKEKNDNEEKEDLLCGETNHLTNFAILFSGAGLGGGCGDDNFDYTVLYLSIGFAVLICCLAFLFIFSTYTRPMRRLLLGKEAYRIYKLRHGDTDTVIATTVE